MCGGKRAQKDCGEDPRIHDSFLSLCPVYSVPFIITRLPRYSIGLVEHFVTECRPASGVIHLVHGIAVCIVVKNGLTSIRRRSAALLIAGAGGSTDSGGHRPQRREEGGKQKQFTLNGIWIHRCGGIVKQTITGSIVQ